jgi:hypothetical protein
LPNECTPIRAAACPQVSPILVTKTRCTSEQLFSGLGKTPFEEEQLVEVVRPYLNCDLKSNADRVESLARTFWRVMLMTASAEMTKKSANDTVVQKLA